MNQIVCSMPYIQSSFIGIDFCVQRDLKPVWDKVITCSFADEIATAFFNQTKTLLKFAQANVDSYAVKHLVFKERETIYQTDARLNPKQFIIEWVNHLGAEFFNPFSNSVEIEFTNFKKIEKLQYALSLDELSSNVAEQIMFSEIIAIESGLDVLVRSIGTLFLDQRSILSSKIISTVSDEDLDYLIDVGLKAKGVVDLIESCSKDWGTSSKKDPQRVVLADSKTRIEFQ